MQLSPHFTLEELTRSALAALRGINNSPNNWQLQNLKQLAQHMEEVRTLLGAKPIIISSGYRSEQLNKAVGGSLTSAHAQGLAVDFTCPQFGSVKDICLRIKNSNLAFDQLIYEQGQTNWCHLGFGGAMRREILSWKAGKGYTTGIVDL